MSEPRRRYHHGSLRQAALDAAVAEVRVAGAAGVSMREIARHAGVSHAALSYQFGDKAGLFTAIATDGFRLAVATIEPETLGPDGFLRGGMAYIRFALAHPAHFEVMFRPDLYRTNDPDLITAREAAFQLLARTAQASGTTNVAGLVVAGWSLSHGFASLWLTANLRDRLGGADPTDDVTHGIATLGQLATEYLNRTRHG